jgi:hypothetical protein
MPPKVHVTMDTTFIELLGVLLLVGVVRLWLGGAARLWAIAPKWMHRPVQAADRARTLPR